MIAVEVSGIEKRYPGGVTALAGIDFAVEEGSVFALLGPNGAGKSTAVRILTTLAKPDAGTASVCGADVVADAGKVRALIGVVSQQHGSDPVATGRENLLLQGVCEGLSGRTLHARVAEVIEEFELGGFIDRRVASWSGGMRRRLDLSLAVIHHPKVLFLDEPTTGLDEEVRQEVWARISDHVGQGMTVVLTTHYLEEADLHAEELIIIDAGRVVASGTPESLKAERAGDALRFEFSRDVNREEFERALSTVPGLSELECRDRSGTARTGDGAAATPLALAALDRAGIAAMSARVSRPSLADVYLHHTGHEFGAAMDRREDAR